VIGLMSNVYPSESKTLKFLMFNLLFM
jgi:hypothetical protein